MSFTIDEKMEAANMTKGIKKELEYIDKCCELLSKYHAISASGYTFRSYLTERKKELFNKDSVVKVAVYFNESAWNIAEPFILDLLLDRGRNFVISSCLSDNNAKKLFSYTNFFGQTGINNHANAKYDQDLIVVVDTENCKIIENVRSKALNAPIIIKFDTLVAQMINYYYFLKPLRDKYNNIPNLTIIPVGSHLFVDENMETNSIGTKFIIENNITLLQIVKDLKNDIFKSKSFSGMSYNNLSDIKEIFVVPPSHYENGHLVIDDISGRFVNVRSGHRVNNALPQASEEYRDIFIVGNCLEFGYGATDNETIDYFLQQRINEVGKKFRVHNYGYFLTNRWSCYKNIIDEIPAKSGDIIFIRSVLRMNDIPDNFFYKLDLSDLFRRPHNYGEVFIDKFHINANGNRAYADSYFNFLQSSDWFENVRENTSVLPAAQLSEFAAFKSELSEKRAQIGAVVMNCNPFTLGHRYLIEQAASQCAYLYVFVVEEDKSFFSFKDRIELVRSGTSDIPNVKVLPSGKFILSSITFSEYFNKSEFQEKNVDASLDLKLFCREIVPILGITVRFVGEEPLDNVTRQYNDNMREILPQYGIEFVEIPRKEEGDSVISASRVRKLLEDKNFEEIKRLVPERTFNYLVKKFSKCED